jgi:ABC-type amino acid transport substrate-binding protein
MLNKKNFTQFMLLLCLNLLLPIVAQAGAKIVASTNAAKIPTELTQTPGVASKILSAEQKWLQASSEQARDSLPLFPPDIQRILDRGKLLVAMPKEDNPPFYAINAKGEYWGLDVELARGFAAELGVGIVFSRTAESYNAAVEEVVQRKVDVAWCKLSRTFKRATRVLYSTPYVVLRQALLINRLAFANQSRNSKSPEEAVQKLHGKIGVIANSSYVGYATQYFRNATPVIYETWDKAVQAAAEGKVVATYRDELEVKKVVKLYPETALKFKTVVITDTTDALAIAVAWDSYNLLALVNIYLENQHLTLNADKILDKYAPQLFPETLK